LTRPLVTSLLLACGVSAAVFFPFWPDLDQAVTGLLFDRTHGFIVGSNSSIRILRAFNSVADVLTWLTVLAALVGKLYEPKRSLLIPGRAILYLAATYLLATGLIANVILKDHWARPRPLDTLEFGGSQQYVSWWDPRGTCERNCSFVSGEVSSATWKCGIAVLLPTPWRAAALTASLIFVAAMGFVRIAGGGHFLSDAVFSILMTAFVLWAVYYLIYVRLRCRLTDAKIDAELVRCSGILRRAFGR
jgi:lipid A 4'-phosphatase